MRRYIACMAVWLVFLGACSDSDEVSTSESDRQLGIAPAVDMRLRDVPGGLHATALEYLRQNAGALPDDSWREGIIVAAWPHTNSGGNCDKPDCWMVQILTPDGTMTAEHIGIDGQTGPGELVPGNYIRYQRDHLALLSLRQDLFQCTVGAIEVA
jgi:hypothetical protein